ncbi:MFS transporter [Rhodospirillum rubrum]|uniref:Major facilitator transporter superfamily MFS_1 n=1 Tax=Rhodospirillum rubrum (strain ATCC 11170 / ATH 1.1.1 / DSM 467 / LMG 4362 / NCIMB 8255 / S1) TaxID=269796 RepID=Q2RW94_RHORT|nr:MFS transporter [Rhodospirillum rubrum]ABC21601.1 major facilitator transporter superfamily MFS_1 [Rhodospirillum rubrum ATCC 11170]AEO47288.1 major facilitator transporter [Rhodospirillum rubrum F11]MBK5953198.1 MFS transporter [Rhodospirillum rubrum]QXG81271.1 MFS transporter [Rhodospirillum rubrum]
MTSLSHTEPVNKPLLWVLGLGTFAIGTDAFIVAGVLREIADDFAVSGAAAGQLITLFAVSYAVFAPVSAWLLGGWGRRRSLLFALGVFALGNIVSAAAPSFALLALSRIIAAFGAASYTPQAVAVAAQLVPPERKGWALSIVYGGMTVATALGIPFGTLIGQTLGWRATFIGVVGLGLLTLAGLAVLLPALAAPGIHTLRERFAAVSRPAVLAPLGITFLAVLSEHTVYSYISLILADTLWDGLPVLPIALVFFGIGAVAGNAASGYGSDRFGTRSVLIFAISAQTAALLGVSLVQPSPLLSCLVLLVWGMAGWMYLVPIQHRLLGLSKTYGSFTVSLNSSVLYLGIGGGGALGGLFITLFGPASLGFLGFALGLLALALALTAYEAGDRDQPPSPPLANEPVPLSPAKDR